MTFQAPELSNTSGVILAGGMGRRMGGREKALIELRGRPLACYVADRLAPQLGPGRLLLNANGPPERFAGIGLPVIADESPNRPGPLAGLLAAMLAAPGSLWIISAPTDTPFLPRDLVRRLMERTGEAEIVLAGSAGGLCQVCGLWSASLAPALATALASGQNKVLSFVQAHRWVRADFPPEIIEGAEIDPFFNLNTQQDIDFTQQLMRRTKP